MKRKTDKRRGQVPDNRIFIDDFNVEVRPGSWGEFGVSYGFVAAIMPVSGVAAVERAIAMELADATSLGIPIEELHGADIATGKRGWGARSIDERVAVVKRVLESARSANVHFVWELVQDGRPEFLAARSKIVDELRHQLPPATLRRLSPEGDPRLSVATVLQRASVLYALTRMGAQRTDLVHDRGVPRDTGIEAIFSKAISRNGRGFTIAPSADSRTIPGLQLADLAGTVLSLSTKLSRHIDELKESGAYPEGDPFDAFTRAIITNDLIPTLESHVRTHRAVDLHL